MAALRKAFKELGFSNTRTYGQSGNVLLTCDDGTAARLAPLIAKKLNDTFGFYIIVIIRTQHEFEEIITNNPLLDNEEVALDKLYVTFLADIPEASIASKINVTPDANERFAIAGAEVYLYCPNGYGRTKLNNATFERTLKTVATTRNWKTINKLFGFFLRFESFETE